MTAVSKLCYALGLAVVLAGPVAAQEKPLKLSFKETSFGKVHTGAKEMLFAADGRHLVYVAKKKNDRWVAVLNGQESAEYPWILASTLIISAQNAKIAFVVQEGNEMRLVRDGKEGPRYKEITRPAFSRDGAHLAYVARKSPGAKAVVILDDKELGEFTNPRNLLFSPDGSRLAFGIDPAEGKRAWVIDGQMGPAYDSLGPLGFSPDSRHWGHMGQRGIEQVMVIDGKESAAYRLANGLMFSPDSKRTAFGAERRTADGKKQVLAVIDGKEMPPFDMIDLPVFSPDSQRVSYVGIVNRLHMLVVHEPDGKTTEGRPHDRCGDAIFSADSKHIVYRAVDEQHWRLIVGEKESKAYDRVGHFIISPDGSRLAFAAKKGTEEYMVLNGQELPGAGNITMSPDGRFIAHADDEGLKSVVLVNGTRGKEFNGFLRGSRWVFDGNDKLLLFAGRDMEILHIEVKIEE